MRFVASWMHFLVIPRMRMRMWCAAAFTVKVYLCWLCVYSYRSWLSQRLWSSQPLSKATRQCTITTLPAIDCPSSFFFVFCFFWLWLPIMLMLLLMLFVWRSVLFLCLLPLLLVGYTTFLQGCSCCLLGQLNCNFYQFVCLPVKDLQWALNFRPCQQQRQREREWERERERHDVYVTDRSLGCAT